MATFDGNNIAIAASVGQLAYAEETLRAVPGGAQVAIRGAINDTLKWARTQLVRLIGEQINLRARDIRDRINIVKRASGGDLEGVIKIDYKAVPLIDFRARFSKRNGVTATIFKGDGAQAFRHQFKATMASSHVGAFQRVKGAPKAIPKHGRYSGRTIKRGPNKGQQILRQPIKEAFAVSVLAAFARNPDLQQQALGGIATKFAERLASKVQWQLQKASTAMPPSSEAA